MIFLCGRCPFKRSRAAPWWPSRHWHAHDVGDHAQGARIAGGPWQGLYWIRYHIYIYIYIQCEAPKIDS